MSGSEKLFLIYQESMDDLAIGYGKNSELLVFSISPFPHRRLS